MATSESENNTFLSDWEIYFDTVSSFISTLGGDRISYANEAYTEYVLERLDYCIHSITILFDHLHLASEELKEEEEEIISSY